MRHTEPENFDIRYTRAIDAAYLRDWLRRDSVARYFPATSSEETDRIVAGWMFFSRYSAGLTATVGLVPCGMAMLFLMPYKKTSHEAGFNLCIDPGYFRRGVGSSLIRNIKHLAADYFGLERIYIEVFDDSPLIGLLKTFGFETFAVQERYVKTETGYKGRVCLIADVRKGESS